MLFLVYSVCGIGKCLAWYRKGSLPGIKKFGPLLGIKKKWSGSVPFWVLGSPFCGMGRGFSCKKTKPNKNRGVFGAPPPKPTKAHQRSPPKPDKTRRYIKPDKTRIIPDRNPTAPNATTSPLRTRETKQVQGHVRACQNHALWFCHHATSLLARDRDTKVSY